MAHTFRYCHSTCTTIIASNTACGSGYKCDIECSGQTARAVCYGAGTLRTGACQTTADCAPGFSCLSSACVQNCVVTADCTGGGSCTGTYACSSVATSFHYCVRG
jgi:hypothetical protein